MRVGLNATCFNDRPSGARQRFVGIYGNLIADNPDIVFVVYEPADTNVCGWFGGAPNVVARKTPVPSTGRSRKVFSSLGYWGRALKQDKLDLFEQFNLPLVKAPDCPTLLTIHDIRRVNGEAPPSLRLIYRAVSANALAASDHVITVSDTMRDEILQFRPGTPVTTIYNGIDPGPFIAVRRNGPSANAAAPYLLSVGHLEPRKNFITLVRAMSILDTSKPDLRLIIVGRDGGSQREIEDFIATHRLSDRIVLRGDVDEEALVRLYADCAAFVFPSTYEGFGIPLLEGMAAGRPVITSDIAVFRELTEGRGATFYATDPADLARTVERILGDPAWTKSLIEYGDRRIADFGFPELAQQVRSLYDRLVTR